MRNPDQLHPYQQRAVVHQCSMPHTMLWMDVGLGKTAITLTSIRHLLDTGFLRGVLIIAPIRVCRLVWRQEAVKWSHTKDLTFSMVMGTRDQRTRALLRPADVYLMNYDNLGWLGQTLETYFVKKNKPIPFNGLVWDEVSKCFAAGTPITTQDSVIAIDKLKVGDKVMTHLGLRSVTSVMTRQSDEMVSVHLSNGQIVHCTPDHPFLVGDEWVGAGSLMKGDLLYGAPHSEVRSGMLPNLSGDILEAQRGTDDLFQVLRRGSENAEPLGEGEDNFRWDCGSSEAPRDAWDMEQGCFMARPHSCEDERVAQKIGSFSPDGWKRSRGVVGGKLTQEGFTGHIRSGVCIQDAVSTGWISDPLQDRLCRSADQDSDRGSRKITHHFVGETKGLEKARVLGKVWVESVVHHKRSGGVDVWNISVDEAETYFAGGVLVHNCKNSTTQRVKAIRKILDQFVWRTGLTGTPASNGYKDLHGQYLVVDEGHRLGTSKTQFRTRFYRPVSQYKDESYPDTEETIRELIGDITLEMSAADYNPLPDLMVNDIEVELPEELRARYDQMERDFFLQMDSGQNKEIFNQASLTNACLQFANGAVYPIAGLPLWEKLHDLKLDALEELVEEANGEPILCAYAYRHDAERIMERFKHLRPINLTDCKSEASLQNAMKRWVEGDCPLMIAHPACLHPETQVLTEWRGWVRIVDVMPGERVHDGVEFVSHRGCHYSGYKDVIEVFGVIMTPDHKLLINDQWVEAQDARDSGISRSEANFRWQKAKVGQSEVLKLRRGASHVSAECGKGEQARVTSLHALHREDLPSDDPHKVLGCVARGEVQSQRSDGQELRWSWNHHGPALVRLSELLRGYVRRLLRRADHRAYRHQRTLLERELSLGNQYGAAKQQAQQSVSHLSRRSDSSCGTLQTNWLFQNDAQHETESRDDCGRGGGELPPVELRKKSATGRCSTQTKAHVYDLVDCGPRNRFLIRNADGDVFVSHNSAGHGIDGLQQRGHILVWFGLNWSLELYDQFNGRLRRQGQGIPVICHRILMRDTLDQAQALALDEKATTQSGLRNAVKQYRLTKGV